MTFCIWLLGIYDSGLDWDMGLSIWITLAAEVSIVWQLQQQLHCHQTGLCNMCIAYEFQCAIVDKSQLKLLTQLSMSGLVYSVLLQGENSFRFQHKGNPAFYSKKNYRKQKVININNCSFWKVQLLLWMALKSWHALPIKIIWVVLLYLYFVGICLFYENFDNFFLTKKG